MLRKSMIMVAVIIFGLATIATAQLPGGKWWKLKKVASELELSPAQVKSIEKVFLTHKKKMIDLKATVEKEQLDLQSMFDSDELDKEAVSEKTDKLSAARSKLHKNQVMFFVQVREILTKKQYEKLREKKEQFKKMRRQRKGKRGGKRQRMMEERNGSDDDGYGENSGGMRGGMMDD